MKLSKLRSFTVKLLIYTSLVIALLLIVTYLPLGLVAFVGLLPSILIFISEKTKGKPMFKTVFPLNVLASIWNYIDAFTQLGFGFVDLSISLVDPTYIFLVILSTGLGFGFYFFIPTIYIMLIDIQNGLKIDMYKRRRKKLIKIWGDGILGDSIDIAEAKGKSLASYGFHKGYLRHRTVFSEDNKQFDPKTQEYISTHNQYLSDADEDTENNEDGFENEFQDEQATTSSDEITEKLEIGKSPSGDQS